MKLFTVDEAQRTLPLLRRIVRDLIQEYARWRTAVGRYELLAAGVRAEWGETPELVSAREAVTDSAQVVNDYLRELDQIGCVFKGFESGLVDFYSLREDRLVFLCWSLGEERIAFWHEVDAGYAGRQPIDDRMLSARSP